MIPPISDVREFRNWLKINAPVLEKHTTDEVKRLAIFLRFDSEIVNAWKDPRTEKLK